MRRVDRSSASLNYGPSDDNILYRAIFLPPIANDLSRERLGTVKCISLIFFMSLSLAPLAPPRACRNRELETFSPFAGETRRIAKPGVGELMEGLKERWDSFRHFVETTTDNHNVPAVSSSSRGGCSLPRLDRLYANYVKENTKGENASI